MAPAGETNAGSTEETPRRDPCKETATMPRLSDLACIILQVNRAADAHAAMCLVLEATIDVLGLDGGGIYIIESDGRATVRHHRFLPPSFVEEVGTIDVAEGYYSTVLSEGRPLFLDDYERENPRRAAAWGIRSLASVPLLSAERIVGALNVVSYTRRSFATEEKTLLVAVGEELGFAVTRATEQQRLRESEADLRRFLDASPDMHFVLDPDGNVLFANPAACSTLGYSAEEMRELHVSELHPSSMRDEAIRLVGQMLAGEADVCPLPVLTRDGRVIPVETRVTNSHWCGAPAIFGTSRDLRTEQLLRATIRTLQDVCELSDPFSAMHGRRVARLAEQLGRELGMAEADITVLGLAASVHDIGNLTVPAMLRCLPAPLPEHQRESVELHPQAGRDILRSMDEVSPIPTIVAQHHERLDGSGYPNGLRGDDIVLEARIIGVADVVVSSASDSPHGPGRSLEAALAEARQDRGTKLDSDVVDACLRLRDGGRLDWLRTAA